jgi:hypothetical protein
MKPSMGIRAFLAVLIASVAAMGPDAGCGGSAGKEDSRVTPDAFRAIAWGSSPPEAAARYPDLVFAGYSLPAGDPEPSSIYVREREEREIFGVTFERVEYWFRNDRLRRVTAVLHDSVGPRTLRSNCEAAFDHASAAIIARFGKPAEDRQAGVFRYGRFESWRVGELRIVLSRNIEGGDSESLSLEISR